MWNFKVECIGHDQREKKGPTSIGFTLIMLFVSFTGCGLFKKIVLKTDLLVW